MNFLELLRRWQRPLSSQKGSSTLQYVIIIAVGVLLAAILFMFMKDSLMQTKVEDKVTQALDGKTTPPVSQPNSEHSNEQTNGNDPINDPKPSPPPPNSSSDSDQKDEKKEGVFDWISDKWDKGTDWVSDKWDKGTKWASDTWNDSMDWLGDQWNQIKEGDLKRIWNDPLGYLGDMVGWEDIKETWNKITSDPLGYLKDSWNVIKDGWNAAWEDPWGTLGRLIFDKDQFMEGWHGKDENGNHIPILNRVWKVAESLPLPTKILKVGSAGKKILVHDGCGCPTGNNKPKENTKPKEKDKSLKPGTPEHKQNRWEVYQANGGKWDYERWSKVYESNMTKPGRSHEAVDNYRKSIGWGTTQVSVDTPNGLRILDIADPTTKKGIEHKTTTKDDGSRGYFSRDERIRDEITKDKDLVADGWEITWVFEKADASKPLLDELKEAGIKVVFK
ncbi:hypothetical protein [Hazenella coriacea]|uniref:Uncharacterized protein n=1 Tax=Hazenella coriacea TaxID=1179467 RepID=A0A4R3LEK6_9BACL|nr:hypothetical protein [Hazenella coriacea]TCS95886.1 hypothetical protein EDD58_102468 [Hazenella coriacea]